MPDAERGSCRRAGERVYPADILADSALGRADLATFGAWMKTLLHLWREKSASICATVCGWAHLWSCSEDEAARILSQFKELGVGDVGSCDGRVTVACRRLLRRKRGRRFQAQRVRRQRSRTGRDGDATRESRARPPEGKGTPAAAGTTTGGNAKDPPSRTPCVADGESRLMENDARLERYSRLWGLCKSGELKELTFRKDGVKAAVLDASPEAITLEYPLARLGGRKCRALLLPPEVDMVQESES